MGCQEETLTRAHAICFGASSDLTSVQPHRILSLEGEQCSHTYDPSPHVLKNGCPESKVNQQTEYQYNWQNY